MAVDLPQIQNNFKKYQTGSNSDYSMNLDKYKTSNKTNKYGDPISTKYKGAWAPNYWGDYTGADGTFTPAMDQMNPYNEKKRETDDKVYAGGSKYFNEKTGKYEKPFNSPPSNGIPNQEKYAHYYKDTYKNDLKKYMNYNGDKITNTNSSEENNINQNAGNKEDWTTTIGNNNDIKYSNIGNDYSVNIGGIGDGFSNMQGAAAYTALNNNQYQRSKSEINGLKRAAQASEQATGLVGAKDRAASLYNSIGYSQNYWRQKADAQQNFYLGDIFAMKAPEYQLPESPSDPMDNDTTQDTLNDFKDELK